MTALPARARRLAERVVGPPAASRRELALVAVAIAVGLSLRLAYVLITQDHTLAGDEPDYDTQGRFLADGEFLVGIRPTGEPHETLWKAPGYPVWVGVWYAILGADVDRVLAVQALLLGPVTIVLTWLLGRHLFSRWVGVLAAGVVAVYPFAWQFEARLYSEALGTPLLLLLLLVVLGRPPTTGRAAVVGALMAVIVLVRPSSILLLAGVALAWWVAAGWRRGTVLTAVTVGVTVLAVAPWTYRNYVIQGGFVPISAQDAAGYGVFNDDAANDPDKPYAWRAFTTRERDLLARLPSGELTETEFRDELRSRMVDYIEEHPESVPKAYFWNGLSRLWDIRRPSHVLDEVPFEGRSAKLTWAGLGMYWVLLPLALAGLWFARARREIVLPVLGIALAASVVYTLDATTRYRAPLEPVIAILACSTLVMLWARWRTRVG